MFGLLKILAIILVSLLGLALFTEYEPETLRSVTTIAGYPLIHIAQEHPRGVIAIGQVDARGVIVIAQLGFGIIAFSQAGAGLLFGVGQAIFGMVIFTQVGFGLFFFLGQLGFGRQALGQLVYKTRPYFDEMNEEFNALLSFRVPREDP